MKRFLMLILTIGSLFAANPYEQIDPIIENAIQNHIFPGATVVVGTADSILYHKAYGTFTYDAGSTVVDTLSIFDMASLTKVFATSMCRMKCIDSGLVSDEDYVKDWIPEFNNNGKGVIKVKNLLMHNSG
ncbi:MAG: beta-lactamase family protein, partial [Candidatus Marinimicrobia bacterium]|nr:beta-lactamase family protein [Candidatus Neomarinimicrobiota bacterium]